MPTSPDDLASTTLKMPDCIHTMALTSTTMNGWRTDGAGSLGARVAVFKVGSTGAALAVGANVGSGVPVATAVGFGANWLRVSSFQIIGVVSHVEEEELLIFYIYHEKK